MREYLSTRTAKFLAIFWILIILNSYIFYSKFDHLDNFVSLKIFKDYAI